MISFSPIQKCVNWTLALLVVGAEDENEIMMAQDGRADAH